MSSRRQRWFWWKDDFPCWHHRRRRRCHCFKRETEDILCSNSTWNSWWKPHRCLYYLSFFTQSFSIHQREREGGVVLIEVWCRGKQAGRQAARQTDGVCRRLLDNMKWEMIGLLVIIIIIIIMRTKPQEYTFSYHVVLKNSRQSQLRLPLPYFSLSLPPHTHTLHLSSWPLSSTLLIRSPSGEQPLEAILLLLLFPTQNSVHAKQPSPKWFSNFCIPPSSRSKTISK